VAQLARSARLPVLPQWPSIGHPRTLSRGAAPRYAGTPPHPLTGCKGPARLVPLWESSSVWQGQRDQGTNVPLAGRSTEFQDKRPVSRETFCYTFVLMATSGNILTHSRAHCYTRGMTKPQQNPMNLTVTFAEYELLRHALSTQAMLSDDAADDDAADPEHAARATAARDLSTALFAQAWKQVCK